MRSFFNRLFAKARTSSKSADASEAILTVFGKHAGWADHIADVPIPTERLTRIYEALYVEGIRGNIDSGAWAKLPDDRKLPGFDHVFVWRFSRESVVGMMWPSSDQVGRSEYPMVACAQLPGLPSSARMREIVALLKDVRQQCTTASTSQAVRAAVEAGQSRLRQLDGAPAPGADEREPDPLATLATLANSPQMGPDRKGLRFVLYQIEREMGLYRPKPPGQTAFTRTVTARPQQFRAPACATSPADAVSLWP